MSSALPSELSLPQVDEPQVARPSQAAPVTLRDALLSPERIGALNECDAELTAYDPDSFRLVFQVRGRNVGTVIGPIIILLIWGIIWAIILDASDTAHTALLALENTFTPLLTTVSFLLVFRLGRAAVRYWDARAAAGLMVEICRVLASDASVACASGPPELREAFCRWIAVFPIAVKNFLRPTVHTRCSRAAELGALLPQAQADALLHQEKCGPLYVLNNLRKAVWRASQQVKAEPAVQALAYRELNTSINTLTHAFGTMERINATPLPFVYVAHLRTFLLVYLALWYLEALASHGWAALPGVALSSWALLGIEAAAIECERPFRRRANHLALGRFCVVVAENVAQTLVDTEI